ncbi:MAG: ribosome biogenesis GTPase Der, partial [Aquincola sp.]|nr:ribosome biogenesis GTPase Der [Aquincola sp.]
MKPVVALVGRPNVGKSTLFNRITKSRDAIVADFAGLTRDRHYGDARLGSREFIVIDTGGFEPDKPTGVVAEMAKQTKQAVAEADAVIFVLDIRSGLSGQDADIARYLRAANKRVFIAINKAEGMAESPMLAEFFELGMGEPHPISAAHGQGIRSLVEAVLDSFTWPEDEDEAADGEDRPIRLAVAGRPNVGKSTLINTWLGEERLIAFDMPGTTRDAIHVPFERNGKRFELIDTAGLRRKGKVFEAIEKFSVVKTLQAIDHANVVVLLLDATQGVSEQDAHIAGYILDAGRAVVLAVNKWDAVDAYQRELVQRSIETRLPFLKFAEIHFISAKKRQGLGP